MKKIFTICFAVILACTGLVYASAYNGSAFPIISGSSSSVVTSSAFNVRGFGRKTVTVMGYTDATATTGMAASGTLYVLCGPTSSGPWNTCSWGTVASTGSVSIANNGAYSWSDAVAYIMTYWKAGSGANTVYIRAWLNWAE